MCLSFLFLVYSIIQFEDFFFIEIYELLESLDVSTLEGGDIYFLGHSIHMMSGGWKTCALLKE